MKPKLSARDLRSGKGCWYYTEINACPLCGREEVYRERRQPPAPPPEKRYARHETSACPEHFL